MLEKQTISNEAVDDLGAIHKLPVRIIMLCMLCDSIIFLRSEPKSQARSISTKARRFDDAQLPPNG